MFIWPNHSFEILRRPKSFGGGWVVVGGDVRKRQTKIQIDISLVCNVTEQSRRFFPHAQFVSSNQA